MNYQLAGVEEQYKDMTKVLKRNDQELIDYQKELEEQKNQMKLEEMRRALEETKKIAGAYKASTKNYVREDENGEVVMLTEADDEDFN